METWKPVLGFEDLYEVSDHGNVRRIARGKTLDGAKVAEAKCMFEQGATLKTVATFLNTSIPTAHSIKLGKTWAGDTSPIPGRLEINHKDLDRANNSLENLELVTHQQNTQHAIDAYKSQGLLRAKKGVKGFLSGKHSAYSR